MRVLVGALAGMMLAIPVVARGREPLLSMVGVCPVPDQPDGWAVVWHTEIPEIERATSARVFTHLEAPDFDRCLRLLVESDPKTLAGVRALKDATTEKPFKVAYKRVNKRWKKFGVDKAIEEVALTGTRGEQVERVLGACKGLR